MLETIGLSAIMVVISGLMTYVIIKKTVNINYILEISDVLLDEFTQNTEMQKKVYILGVLLGNGVRQGIGINKGKGKFKFEDLVGVAIGHIFGGKQRTQENLVSDLFMPKT